MEISKADFCKLTINNVSDLLLEENRDKKNMHGLMLRNVDRNGQLYNLYVYLECVNIGEYDFKKLKKYVARLNTVIGELESLEDFEDADYSEIKTDIGDCTVLLEQRRERLQRRGRTQ